MEMGFRLGAAQKEDTFWHQTLRNLAARLGVQGRGEQTNTLIDNRLRWNEAGNIWYCGALRSSPYMPWHLLQRMISYRKKHA
jgi:hypothetical protein